MLRLEFRTMGQILGQHEVYADIDATTEAGRNRIVTIKDRCGLDRLCAREPTC